MSDALVAPGVWSPERALAWQRERGWRVGCNFVPSTASNPLEMWQAETFDPDTIGRELGFAAGLGFTSVRVFLHDLLFEDDAPAWLDRIEGFLRLASGHGIGVMFVFFDGVWDPQPRPGPQPEPTPGVHNSRWVQSPGAAILADAARQDGLRPYLQGVLDRFRDDSRIDCWDLFNEPDNPNPAYAAKELPDKAERALALLRKAFAWAREVAPSQPLTAGVWRGRWSDPGQLSEMDRTCIEGSDCISFHHYGRLEALQRRASALRRHGRPLLCTEYLARGIGSCFDPHLGWMASEGIGAYCWGLVAGRSQTQYPWDSWAKPYLEEPTPWHHEILRADGTAYDPAERAFIRSLTQPR